MTPVTVEKANLFAQFCGSFQLQPTSLKQVFTNNFFTIFAYAAQVKQIFGSHVAEKVDVDGVDNMFETANQLWIIRSFWW